MSKILNFFFFKHRNCHESAKAQCACDKVQRAPNLKHTQKTPNRRTRGKDKQPRTDEPQPCDFQSISPSSRRGCRRKWHAPSLVVCHHARERPVLPQKRNDLMMRRCRAQTNSSCTHVHARVAHTSWHRSSREGETFSRTCSCHSSAAHQARTRRAQEAARKAQ